MIGTRSTRPTGPRLPAASFDRRSRRRARAFTLAEALVLLTIVVLLVGLLVPTVARVRQSARDVMCVGRIHDLSVACTAYYVTHDRYPAPFRGVVAAMPLPALSFTPSNLPQGVDLNLINALSPYFKYPPIGPTLPAAALPPAVQSPPVEALLSGRGPFASADPTDPVYYTGFVYTGRMEEWPNLLYVNGVLRQTSNGASTPSTQPLTFPGVIGAIPPVPTKGLPSKAFPIGIVLQPGRSGQSPATSNARAVLWADDVHLTASPGGYWQYAHVKRRVAAGPLQSSYLDASGCRGQHRGYVDGSVEWIDAAGLGLDVVSKNADGTATYRLAAAYWWY